MISDVITRDRYHRAKRKQYQKIINLNYKHKIINIKETLQTYK